MSILILGQMFNFRSIFASTLTNFFYTKIYAFHSKIMEYCTELKFSCTCFCTFQTLSKSILNNLRVFFLFEGYSKLIPSKGLQVMQKCSKWRDKSSKNTIKMKLVDYDEKIGRKWKKWSKSKIDISCGQNKSNFLKIGQTLGYLRAISKKTYSIQHPVVAKIIVFSCQNGCKIPFSNEKWENHRRNGLQMRNCGKRFTVWSK